MTLAQPPSYTSFISRWPPGPSVRVVRAWAWLCASTDDLTEKQRCLGAILELEPDLEWMQLVSLEGKTSE